MEASSTCLKHLTRVSPPQTSPPPLHTQWPSETYQMAQNGELVGLPCSAGSFKLTRSPKRRGQPIIIIITVIPNSALNVVPFTHTHSHSHTHTHTHMHAEVKKKENTSSPYSGSTWVLGRKWEGVKEKKGPRGGGVSFCWVPVPLNSPDR